VILKRKKKKWIPAIHTTKVTVRYFTYHGGVKESKILRDKT